MEATANNNNKSLIGFILLVIVLVSVFFYLRKKKAEETASNSGGGQANQPKTATMPALASKMMVSKFKPANAWEQTSGVVPPSAVLNVAALNADRDRTIGGKSIGTPRGGAASAVAGRG